MNEIKIWLMDFVVEAKSDFSSLIYVNPSEGFEEPPSKFSKKEIIEGLVSLFDLGFILAYMPSCSLSSEISLGNQIVLDNFDIEKGMILDPQLIQECLLDRYPAYYGLTPKGGAYWESITEHSWEQYFVNPLIYEEGRGEALCMDPQVLEEFLSLPILSNQKVLSDTAKWDILSPWQATYWKQLPYAHRISYQFQPQEQLSSDVIPNLLEMISEVDAWYRKVDEWYKRTNNSQ